MIPVPRWVPSTTAALVLIGAALPGGVRAAETVVAEIWRQLEPGLELARFSTADTAAHPAGDLVVLRIDPTLWSLQLLCAAAQEDPRNRDARQWCAEFGLAAAINAGMFQADRRTHVGFLQCDGRVENPTPNAYLSALAFSPRIAERPPLRVYDLDVTPLESLVAEYSCVVQNLRLVKRPRDSRWQRRDRAWCEAALGEDGAGRALLIYCRAALSMPELIDLLLALPIDLQAAQHLEGGAEAQLYVAHPDVEGDFRGTKSRWISWPVPNVLGVVPRAAP